MIAGCSGRHQRRCKHTHTNTHTQRERERERETQKRKRKAAKERRKKKEEKVTAARALALCHPSSRLGNHQSDEAGRPCQKLTVTAPDLVHTSTSLSGWRVADGDGDLREGRAEPSWRSPRPLSGVTDRLADLCSPCSHHRFCVSYRLG